MRQGRREAERGRYGHVPDSPSVQVAFRDGAGQRAGCVPDSTSGARGIARLRARGRSGPPRVRRRPEIVSVRSPFFAGFADEPGIAQQGHRLAGVTGAGLADYQVQHAAAGVRLMVPERAGVLAVHVHDEASMSAVAPFADRAQPRVRLPEQGLRHGAHERREVDRRVHDPLRSSFESARYAFRLPVKTRIQPAHVTHRPRHQGTRAPQLRQRFQRLQGWPTLLAAARSRGLSGARSAPPAAGRFSLRTTHPAAARRRPGP